MDNIKKSPAHLKLGVREFVNFAFKEGGLFKAFVSLDSADSTEDYHKRAIEAYIDDKPSAENLMELPLKLDISYRDINLELRGRADLISINPDTHSLTVLEVKTILDDKIGIPKQPEIIHLAQAKVYAHLYLQANKDASPYERIYIQIRYYHLPSGQLIDFTEGTSEAELESFFNLALERLYKFTSSINNYKSLRDTSIASMKFPYPDLRMGQKDFMGQVLEAIRDKEPLFVQAPTGIGKTISTLYPAIKSIPHNYSDYIFYLTAKTSTQDVALEQLKVMKDQGLIIKSLRITAKEKVCLRKDIYCDTTICEYATSYFDNSRAALEELIKHNDIDQELLIHIGEKHKVCPFEIGLDASTFCDIIVCDYNYAFDPRIRLSRFFNEEEIRKTLLIDEAHNLASRSNEMYSAKLSPEILNDALKYIELYPKKLIESFQEVTEYMAGVEYFLTQSESSSNDSENPRDSGAEDGHHRKKNTFDNKIQANNISRLEQRAASRELPRELIKILDNFVINARLYLDNNINREANKALLELFFEYKFFIRVAKEFFNEDFICLLSNFSKQNHLQLACLNASDHIAEVHNGKNTAVFFSATMSPDEYYLPLFAGKKARIEIHKMILPSPFTPENLFLGIVSTISTKYAMRPFTVDDISQIIYAASMVKKGNYLIYCPSFQYLEMLHKSFGNLMEAKEKPNFKIIRQKRGMNQRERNKFLNNFYSESNSTLLGFAVMGGVFGEGIDLTGDKLSGVFIVGVGLPTLSFEQNIMMDYFENLYGRGFDYAYKFPGFNKVLQAAGRVIRTPEDRGFIFLIDERYDRPDYRQLFPIEWDPINIENPKAAYRELNNFFG